MNTDKTIFKQLILNVITPVVIAILILGFLNYTQTRSILKEANQTKNQIITDEIKHILSFQDYSLELVEESMDKELKDYSNTIVTNLLSNTESIESVDLYKIREQLNMDSTLHDIYILNRNGIVVNTTFKQDMGFNFYSFGEGYKNMLLGVLDGGKFVGERFAVETKTKKLKKYTYQPTLDGQYIIELGSYSSKASEIVDAFKVHLNNLESKYESIDSIDMFIGEDHPISFSRDSDINAAGRLLLAECFAKKQRYESTEVRDDGKSIQTEFIYMDRKGTDLYKGAVIRIVTDKTKYNALLKNELLELLLIFAISIFSVVILIYKKTRVITSPIKKLVDKVTRISDGNLNERASVEGSNEIANLSIKFNQMVERLEESYNDLEQKVIDRTAEIHHQKLEIEEQNKHIMDSIFYAKRIQNAILPASEYVKKHLPDAYLLYKPKDIVSGDFYWMKELDGQVLIAAVDCTGHGVPGAFMSIIGHNQLNHAINIDKARKPGDILDRLNVGVTNVLSQELSEDAVKDGMDISLCNIDFKNSFVQYAGAFNPLYIITNNEDTIKSLEEKDLKEFEFNGYRLFEVKGNKQPIGNFDDNGAAPFINNEIQLNKGDSIYIFSDGYADQFGGPRGKKFRYKNFKELIMGNQHLSMKEQYKLLDDTIEDWRGDLEQIDDILVIGVQL
jgi:sigma-B regulation protein RsbU (phosphoserine phosphatase)